jgi:glycerol-3-phosphate dehydrogenase
LADYDLAVIGGGLTGASVARDAAGRGLRVALFEQGDLANGASSASSRLMVGDLQLLERRALASVRRSLLERDRQLRLAPHLVRPLRFVIPLHPQGRPVWLLRLGLSVYDRLGAGPPASETLDLSHHEAGFCLQRPYGSAFEFSDAVADDARLVVLNAVDAAVRGADICTGARCVRADRDSEWRLALIDRGRRRNVTARALVSAVGAWTGQFAETVLRRAAPPLALVRESQIIVRRLFEHDQVYVLQQPGGALVFAQRYDDERTLIGMARAAFNGDLAATAPTAADIIALCTAANGYFREQISPADVVGTTCGVRARPLVRGRPEVPRSGVMRLDRRYGEAPLVVAFGGEMTSYRLQAETIVDALASFYDKALPWTAAAPLPGGDFSDLDVQIEAVRRRYPFLGDAQARRLTLAYGTRVKDVLGEAERPEDLGPVFGAELTAAEVRYLIAKEYARSADDILWRRSKFGLSMPSAARDALAQFVISVS